MQFTAQRASLGLHDSVGARCDACVLIGDDAASTPASAAPHDRSDSTSLLGEPQRMHEPHVQLRPGRRARGGGRHQRAGAAASTAVRARLSVRRARGGPVRRHPDLRRCEAGRSHGRVRRGAGDVCRWAGVSREAPARGLAHLRPDGAVAGRVSAVGRHLRRAGAGLERRRGHLSRGEHLDLEHDARQQGLRRTSGEPRRALERARASWSFRTSSPSCSSPR